MNVAKLEAPPNNQSSGGRDLRRVVMRVIWRFFVGEDARWRWQQLSVDRAVVAESRSSYEKYERCLAAAQSKGYVFEAAQPRLPRPGNRIYSRP